MAGSPKLIGSVKTSASGFGTHYDPDAVGKELYQMFLPVVDAFGDNGDLLNMCRGFGKMLQPIDNVAKDGPNGEPGYSQILDPERAPVEWLPWLGQWVGYFVTPQTSTETEAQWEVRERAYITKKSAHRRGTNARLIEEVQSYLNDPKQVFLWNRATTAHKMTLFYYTAQLKSGYTAADVNTAAQAQKAKGLLLTVTPLSGGDWNTLTVNSATWNTVVSKFANWNEVAGNPAKP